MFTLARSSRTAKTISIICVFALLFSFLTPPAAAAAEIQVDGSNGACTGSGQADRFAGIYCTIQAAVADAQAGDTLRVADGVYNENITLNKNLTLLSVNGRDATTIAGTEAAGGLGTLMVSPGSTGVQIGDTGQGFTIVGFDSSTPGIEKAAVYFQGAHSNAIIKGNRIAANGDAGLMTEYGAVVSNFLIEGNEFSGKTFTGENPAGSGFGEQFTLLNVPRQLVVMGGGAGGTNASHITFTGNLITGTAGGYNTLGIEQGNTLVTIDADDSTFTGNTFAGVTSRGAPSLRVRRPNAVITGNTFSSAGLTATAFHLYLVNNPISAALCAANTFDKLVCYDSPTGGYLGTNLQAAVLSAAPGSTISVSPGTFLGGVTINKSLTLDGGGALIGPGSPAFTITANDVTILNFIVDGTSAVGTEPGILVVSGVERLYLHDLEIRNWPGAGIEFAGAITDLKLIDNYIHSNDGDGVSFAAAPGGLAQIYGNAFRQNGGFGINSAGPVSAEYNEWGSYGGPAGTGGDGASANVAYTPYVFGKVYAQAPATVREGAAFSVDVLVDAQSLYGAQFKLSYDPALLTFTSVNVGGAGYFQGAPCQASLEAPGLLGFYCTRQGPDAVSAEAVKLATINFQANTIAVSSQQATLNLVDEYVGLSAPGGIRIFIDSIVDDTLTILGTTTVTGRVDLQGRSSEAGAVVDPAAGTQYGMDAAPFTTGLWGTFTFAGMTDDEYVFTVEMPRYLDASATVNVAGGTLNLATVVLLGGDVDDDDDIDIFDASAIGSSFWTTPATPNWNANADINNDGRIDILDLTIMGGNYEKTSSPWVP